MYNGEITDTKFSYDLVLIENINGFLYDGGIYIKYVHVVQQLYFIRKGEPLTPIKDKPNN